jgi:hypothetical protein
MDPEREVDVRIARVPLAGDAEHRSVLFMLEGSAFAGAAVLDADGVAIEEWKHFLEGFQFYDVPRLANAKPRSFLAEERERLSKSKGDDARLALALMDVLQHMNAQAAPFCRPGRPTALRSPNPR